MFKDDEFVNFGGLKPIGNHCVHDVLLFKNVNLVRPMPLHSPRVAQIDNKTISTDKDDPKPAEDHLTSKDIISKYPDTMYIILNAYQYPDNFKIETVITP